VQQQRVTGTRYQVYLQHRPRKCQTQPLVRLLDVSIFTPRQPLFICCSIVPCEEALRYYCYCCIYPFYTLPPSTHITIARAPPVLNFTNFSMQVLCTCIRTTSRGPNVSPPPPMENSIFRVDRYRIEN